MTKIISVVTCPTHVNLQAYLWRNTIRQFIFLETAPTLIPPFIKATPFRQPALFVNRVAHRTPFALFINILSAFRHLCLGNARGIVGSRCSNKQNGGQTLRISPTVVFYLNVCIWMNKQEREFDGSSLHGQKLKVYFKGDSVLSSSFVIERSGNLSWFLVFIVPCVLAVVAALYKVRLT